MTGLSSRSKGSIRAASRRRRNACASHVTARGREAGCCRFRLHDGDRRRDLEGAARRARLRPGRHAAAVRRQPLRKRGARSRAGWRGRGRSSATATWRRASPTARRRASILPGSRDIQRFLPRPDLTILLDIAPETAVQRKAAGRDRYERDLALLSRVRDSYRRQARAGRLVDARRRAPREARSRPTWSARSRHDSRGGKRAHLARARLAAAPARTPRASRPSCSHRRRAPPRDPSTPRTPRRSANASRTFA